MRSKQKKVSGEVNNLLNCFVKSFQHHVCLFMNSVVTTRDLLVGLEDSAHVLKVKDDIYNAVLGMVDLVRGTNSYYKFQLLEADGSKRFVRVCECVRACVRACLHVCS